MWRICHIVTADKLRLYISNTAWKLLSFKKNYLNSKINVNIYLRLVINSKDWCDKEQRQSTSFFFFFSWISEHIQRSLILQIFILCLFQSCLDIFLLTCPITRDWKAKYTGKNEHKRKGEKKRVRAVKSLSRRFCFQITETKFMR